jgi:putative FmdB family regulatory protein
MVAGVSALRRRGVPSLRFDQPATSDLTCAGPAGLAVRGDGSIVVAISTTREASMPTYVYGCERCGPFTETRPLAEFALPQPCPNCGDLATRALTSPAIGGGAREASFLAPGPAHPGGCRCCAAPGRFCAESV